MNSLTDVFQDLATLIPSTEDEDPGFLSLGLDNLPRPPEQLTTDRICLTLAHRFYNDFPVESVSMETDKPTLCYLGLLILAALFHRSAERVALDLTHPRSTIKRLVVGHDWGGNSDYPGLILRPERFNYYPEPLERYPWTLMTIEPHNLPVLYLTNRQELITSPSDLAGRDVAVGFGTVEASALFAELLLNASRPDSSELEFHLESELGVRGVGPGSTEIVIWLPGSLGNLDHEPLDSQLGSSIGR